MRNMVGTGRRSVIGDVRSSLLAGVSVAALVLVAGPQTVQAQTLDLNGNNLTLPQAPSFGGQTYLNGGDNLTNNGGANATLTEGGGPVGNIYSGTVSDGATKTTAIIHTSGVTILTGNNTYSGGTTIKGGTVTLGSATGLGSGTLTFDKSGGTLTSDVTTTFSNRIEQANGATMTIGAAAGKTLTLTGFANLLGSLSSGSVTTHFGSATETGTVVFAPSATNVTNFSVLSVDGGTLKAGNGNGVETFGFFGGFVDAAVGGVVVGTGTTTATLDLNGFDQKLKLMNLSGNANGIVTTTGGIVPLRNTKDSTFAGVLTGAFGVTVANSGSNVGLQGTLTLTGANTYSGGTTIEDKATLRLGDGTTTGTVVGNITNNGTLNFAPGAGGLTVNNVVSGSGKVVASANKTTFGVAQTYTGTTSINNSATLAGGAANVFSAGSATTVNTGGTLDLGGFAQTINDLTLAGGTITNGDLTSASGIKSNGGTVNGISGSTGLFANSNLTTVLGNNTFTGPVTIANGAGLRLGDGTVSGSVNGNISNNGILSFVPGAGGMTFGAVVSGSGQVAVGSSNKTTLTGTNTYTGLTTIASGATLQLGNGGATGSIDNSIGIANSGALVLNRNNALGIKNVTGTGTVTQDGIGTTTLSGTNTYAGATTINAGTLKGGANNTFSANSTVTINNSGTADLGGAGVTQTVKGVNLNPGGTLTNGTLTSTNGITATGGTINNVLGAVMDSGSSSLTATGGNTTLTGTDSFTNVTVNSGATITVNGTTSIDLAGQLQNKGGTVDINGQLQFGPTAQAVTGQKVVNTLGGKITVNAGGKVFDDVVNNASTVNNSGAYVGDVAVNTGTNVTPGIINNNAGATWDGKVTNGDTGANTGFGQITNLGKWTGNVLLNHTDSTIDNKSGATWTGTLSNTWTAAINGGKVTNDGAGTNWNGAVVGNTGTINNQNTATWTGALDNGTAALNGTVNNKSGAIWNGAVNSNAFGSTIINTDAATNWNGDVVTNGGSITNQATATWTGDVKANSNNALITNTGNGTNWKGNVVTNQGTISNESQATWTGNVVANTNFINNKTGATWKGDVQSNSNTIINESAATWTGNAGTVTANNGNIINQGVGTLWDGTVKNAFGVANSTAFGVINRGGAAWKGDVVSNTAAGVIVNTDVGSLGTKWTGNVQSNNGRIVNEKNATWTGDVGTVTANAGTITNDVAAKWNSVDVKNAAAGTITNAGSWTNTGTLTNSGTVTITGTWNGAGTIINNANAILNGSGTIVANTTNNGTFNVAAPGLTQTGNINNTGTTNLNANLAQTGVFTNAGTMNVNDNKATVTTLAGNGNFTFTTNLSTQTTGTINATNLTSNGTANYTPSGGGNLLNGGFLAVINATNAPVGTITGGTKDVGFVKYTWGKNGNSFGWLSAMNANFTPLASISGAQSVISSSFHTPLSNYVNSKANPRPNEFGCGTWGRAEGARFNSNSLTTSTTGVAGSVVSVNNAMRYNGIQGGLDCAVLNGGGTGWNSHFGFNIATVQANVGTSDNTPGSGGKLLGTVDVDTTSFGLYAFFQNGGFTLDLSARRDIDSFKFKSSSFIVADTVNGGATGLSATGAYRFQLTESAFLQPFGGLSWSGSTMNQFFATSSGSTFSIGSDQSNTLIGRVGGQLSFVQQISANTFLVPFVAGSLVHNFEGTTSLMATQGGVSTFASTQGVRDYRQADLGLSIANSAISGTAYVKGTVRDGDMQGASVSAGGRINF